MSEMRSSRAPYLATPLIAVVSFTSVWALSDMVQIGSWVSTTALLLIVVALSVLLTRVASRSKVAPTLVGIVASVLVLVPTYARGEEGQGFLLPTPSALSALLETLKDGVDYASRAPSPAEVVNSFGSLITVGILVIFLLSEHIAVSMRAVATSGLLLFAAWIPAIVDSQRVPSFALLVGLAAWVLTMTVSRKDAPIERGIALSSAVYATTASLLLTGFAAPAALGGEGWGSIPDIDTPNIFDAPTSLNLQLDLRNSLDSNSDSPVLIYLSSGGKPDAFRIYTLTDFDGAGWSYESPEPTNHRADTGLLWPEAVEGWNDSERVTLHVSVLSLAEDHLPIPTTPRTVEVVGAWSYDSDSDTIIGDSESTRNLTYAIVTDTSYMTARDLRATEALLEDPAQDVDDPVYLEVPPAIDLENIRGVTEGLIDGKTTRYDKALAIQNYLRNPSVFTYTTSVDPAPGDAVSAFLESKQGYCLQFATTMVIMLRSVGIPARLGYGFLPGEKDAANGYIVRGKDAHVWPEVYFPDYGWVRFEPTPSIQTGSPPKWADPFSGEVVIPVPRSVLDGGGYPVGPSIDQPTNPDGDSSTTTAAPLLPAWAIRTICVLTALGLFAGFFWWRRRSGATERALHGPEGAWQRLATRLGEFAWPASATPLEARSHVLRSLSRVEGRPPSPSSSEALTALSSAVSDHRYSPDGTQATQYQLDAWVVEVVSEAEVVAALATGRPARGGARTAPRGGS